MAKHQMCRWKLPKSSVRCRASARHPRSASRDQSRSACLTTWQRCHASSHDNPRHRAGRRDGTCRIDQRPTSVRSGRQFAALQRGPTLSDFRMWAHEPTHHRLRLRHHLFQTGRDIGWCGRGCGRQRRQVNHDRTRRFGSHGIMVGSMRCPCMSRATGIVVRV